MIYFIRFITAACLFSFLGKANIWLNPLSNVILAIGYRFFLVLSPLFSKLIGKYAIASALIISALGTFLFCFYNDYLLTTGAILVGMGLSISGYLIKFEASETPKGAAYNKIALNVGSLLSGIVLIISLNSKSIFFGISAIILCLAAMFSLVNHKKKNNVTLRSQKKISKKRLSGWLLVGIAVGIKLFSALSILPQYILATTSSLPSWYGVIVFVSSAIIIIFQLPIIHWVEKFKENNNSFKITLGAMISGMLIIAFPQIFYAHTLLGALIWTILLSIIECFASYLDVQGSRSGSLLIKETAVGLGAGLTVFFSRYFHPPLSSLAIGIFGILAIVLAFILLYDELKTSEKSQPVGVVFGD